MKGKQRSFLKKMAHSLRPLIQLGKSGISNSFIQGLDKILEDHELVKITVLDGYTGDIKEAADEICSRSDAEYIQQIGKKITIYRQSRTNPMIEIPGADNKRVIANKQRKGMI